MAARWLRNQRCVLTQSAHRVVDVAGWASSVRVDRSDDELVLRFWQQPLQNHGVGLYGLADVRPLRVHLRPVKDKRILIWFPLVIFHKNTAAFGCFCATKTPPLILKTSTKSLF